MKDGMESTAARRAPELTETESPRSSEPRSSEQEEFINRKLIRPSLNRGHFDRSDNRERTNGGTALQGSGLPKRGAPAEQTHAESFYYQKQMQSRTTMVIVLKDGEEIQGWIEWYDRNCIKVNRNGQPNLLIYKLNIKYMYKAGENQRR
jgi:host factor-I protein